MQCTDIKQTERTGYLLIFTKCESTSDKLHAALYNFTVTCSSHMNWISGFMLCTVQFIRSLCVLYCRINCNCYERSDSDVIKVITENVSMKFRMTDLQRLIRNWDFPD